MSFQDLYAISFLPAAPFWLLMIALPTWHRTKKIIHSPWIFAPSALFYTGMLLAAAFGNDRGDFPDFSTIAGLAEAFSSEVGALAVWAHMIAIDLVAGRWVYLDSRNYRIPIWARSINLLVVLNAGPLGILIYLVVRRFSAKVDREKLISVISELDQPTA